MKKKAFQKLNLFILVRNAHLDLYLPYLAVIFNKKKN